MQCEFVYDPAGRELGQYNYTRGYWEDQYVPLGARQLTKYYGCCDTEFLHPNHLGSTVMVTNQTGTITRDELFYPFGQMWWQIGRNYDTRFASMWQREFASGLDPTPNRLYHSRLLPSADGLTPDEFTGQALTHSRARR